MKNRACLWLCDAFGLAAEREAPPAYLAGFKPAEIQAAADVVLQLRDGARLPAHSQLLASTSPLLCDMLNISASQAPAGSKTELPLPEFSEWRLSTCSRRVLVDKLWADGFNVSTACQPVQALIRHLVLCLPLDPHGLTIVSFAVVYPATSSEALRDDISPHDRRRQAAAMRQALALLRWAHKFGPEEHVQRAERFLCERLQLLATVRPQPWSPYMRWHCTSCTSESALTCCR